MVAVGPVVTLSQRQTGEDDSRDNCEVDYGEDGVDADGSLSSARYEHGESQHDGERKAVWVFTQPRHLDVTDVGQSGVADGATEYGVEGAAPGPRHCRYAQPVFQDDIPADDEGAQLSYGHVRVGVGRPGLRNP